MQEYRELITRQDHAEAAALLQAAGLDYPDGVTFGLGFYEDGQLQGTGFLAGNVLCGICIAPSQQGAGLSAGMVTRLVQHANAAGQHKLLLFTKPTEVDKFQGLGLALVARSAKAALLEFGQPDCQAWVAAAQTHAARLWAERGLAALPAPDAQAAAEETPPRVGSPVGDSGGGSVGAIVMNANPFTLGHRHLALTALAQAERVYVFVVEEDASAFPFAVRLTLVRQGLADQPRAVVLPSGPYMVSRASFPAYFTGREAHSAAHAALDCAIFAERIAKPLGITTRFIGQEPYCPVTAAYNAQLQETLPQHGIACVEIPRLEEHGQAVSASRVRQWLAQSDATDTNNTEATLAAMVPPSTLAFLQSDAAQAICQRLREKQTRH